jgi:hypothetical protein
MKSLVWATGFVLAEMSCQASSSAPLNIDGSIVTGQVVFKPSGGEAFSKRGVTVTLDAGALGVLSTETDDQGTYRFDGAPAANVRVAATHPFSREKEVSAEVEVGAGAAEVVPTLALTPAGAVRGRARLVGAGEHANTRVSLDGTDLVTTTDEEGVFLLTRVPVGTYRVRWEKPGFGGRTLRGIEVGFMETTDVETVDIEEGVEADFNHPPTFDAATIAATRWQRRPGTLLDPIALDLEEGSAARFDTVTLDARASDLDGDRLTFFWTVTAGVLDRTDAARVSWTLSDEVATSATASVRVIDERSGSISRSLRFGIADLQTPSARLVEGHLVYAYRRLSGAWRIIDDGEGAQSRVAEISSLDDPKPTKVGGHYVASPSVDGERRLLTWQAAEPPALHTFEGTGEIMAAGSKLVRAFSENGRTRVRAYDLDLDTVRDLYTCGERSCGELRAASSTWVVSVAHEESRTMLHAYDLEKGVLLSMPRAFDIGTRIRIAGDALVFSDAAAGFERAARNSLLLGRFTPIAVDTLYAGLYDVRVGAYDGRFLAFTEQSYRAVYSQEEAFVWDTQTLSKTSLDPSRMYAHDEVFGIDGSRALVRRYPRQDWLREAPSTHYELCWRALP